MSIVSKEEYWTTILNDYSQFDQITTEDSKFNSIANDVWNVLENSFIKIDDEESIIKWEEMTGLSGEGLTIFQRKVNILYTLTIKNYLPISLFTQAMDRLVGEENYIIIFNEDTQKYEVECYEDYETSASFLNKRLANGCVDLETTSLPFGYLAAEFVEKSVVDGQYTSFPDYYGENKGLKMTAILYNLATTTEVVGTPYSSDGYFSHPTNAYYFLSYFGKNYYTSIDLGEKYVVEINWKNDGIVRKRANTFYEAALAPSKEVWGGRITSGKNAQVKIYDLQLSEGSNVIRNYIPALTPQGGIVLYDTVQKQEVAYKCDVIGFTPTQARKLSKLPKTGGSLTVSLPWEAQLVQYNTEVEAALQAAKSNGWTITVQYRDPEPDNAVYNKYASCTTVAEMAAVNPNFRTDLTTDGGWIYPLPELTNLANLAWGGNYSPEMPIKYLDCDAPKVKLTNPGFVHNCQPEWARGDWSGVENGMWMFGAGHKRALYNVEMVFPKLHTGDAMFEGAILNKESVLRILGSIPSYTSGTHKLTMGIHVDHQTDDEVLAAIENAEAKGWTLTVQWNGTATAQVATYGLRRKPVYAKLATMELPDGTTEQYLDWGHYVTDWDANDYREFSSVEEAKEHFNIGD